MAKPKDSLYPYPRYDRLQDTAKFFGFKLKVDDSSRAQKLTRGLWGLKTTLSIAISDDKKRLVIAPRFINIYMEEKYAKDTDMKLDYKPLEDIVEKYYSWLRIARIMRLSPIRSYSASIDSALRDFAITANVAVPEAALRKFLNKWSLDDDQTKAVERATSLALKEFQKLTGAERKQAAKAEASEIHDFILIPEYEPLYKLAVAGKKYFQCLFRPGAKVCVANSVRQHVRQQSSSFGDPRGRFRSEVAKWLDENEEEIKLLRAQRNDEFQKVLESWRQATQSAEGSMPSPHMEEVHRILSVMAYIEELPANRGQVTVIVEDAKVLAVTKAFFNSDDVSVMTLQGYLEWVAEVYRMEEAKVALMLIKSLTSSGSKRI